MGERGAEAAVPRPAGARREAGHLRPHRAGVGSDAANLATTARRDGDRYILNGSKIWISLADTADHFLVFATVDRSQGHKGITAFIVERSFPGFSSDSLHGKLGVRAGNTGVLYFNDCEVPAANRVGEGRASPSP